MYRIIMGTAGFVFAIAACAGSSRLPLSDAALRSRVGSDTPPVPKACSYVPGCDGKNDGCGNCGGKKAGDACGLVPNDPAATVREFFLATTCGDTVDYE